MPRVDEVYQVFIDYFGEDRVDKQEYPSESIHLEYTYNIHSGDSIILVHWPTVTVSNEYDGHIDIWDLYSATIVTPEGKMKEYPYFIRSTYDRAQWESSYIHSHIQSLNKSQLNKFKGSCLGSGPINATIGKLRTFPFDSDIWRLYCWELDKYVAVESLNGGPYMRLQNVGVRNNATTGSSSFYLQPKCPYDRVGINLCIRMLIEALLKNQTLKFAYSNGTFNIASPYVDAVLQISNTFIELYNELCRSKSHILEIVKKEELFDVGFIARMRIFNNVIYSNKSNSYNPPIEAAIGSSLFTFKGEEVKLKLKDFNQDYEANDVYLLDLNLVNYIITTLLKYINLCYGKPTNTINKEVRIV